MLKKDSENLNFHIISMATYGHGLSGGDRIWIELAKRISLKHQVSVYLWEEGKEIATREGLKGVNYVMWSAKLWSKLGFFVNYFARVLIAVFHSLKLELENSPDTVVYSASEFWQDSFPVLFLKLRHPKIIWMAAWYQTAPNPFVGFAEGKRKVKYRVRALLYWLAQMPVKLLIRKYADKVIVNNEDEKKHFPGFSKRGDILVLIGSVPLEEIKSYKLKAKSLKLKKYDAVFQGRFHAQKGVVELIDIWRKVVEKLPDAKLAMIGDGPLMESVKLKVKKEKLEKNIKLFGYVFDGPLKYSIFHASKIVVHPAFYDSGGMASAEAMAFGLPCVGFNLKAYESYYPEGMVKVETGDLESFCNKIVFLLEDEKAREKIGRQATRMIESNWSWDNRVKQIFEYVQN